MNSPFPSYISVYLSIIPVGMHMMRNSISDFLQRACLFRSTAVPQSARCCNRSLANRVSRVSSTLMPLMCVPPIVSSCPRRDEERPEGGERFPVMAGDSTVGMRSLDRVCLVGVLLFAS